MKNVCYSLMHKSKSNTHAHTHKNKRMSNKFVGKMENGNFEILRNTSFLFFWQRWFVWFISENSEQFSKKISLP